MSAISVSQSLAEPFSLEFRPLARLRPFDLVSPIGVDHERRGGFELSTSALTDEGPKAPFASVVVGVDSIDKRSGLHLGVDDGADGLLVRYLPSEHLLRVVLTTSGEAVTVAEQEGRLRRRDVELALVVNADRITVLVNERGRGWTAVLSESYPRPDRLRLRDPEVLGRMRYRYGNEGTGNVRLSYVRAGCFGQVGFRDPHVVQYADGRPYVRDGKMYLTLTHAGLGFFQQAHWGVWTLDVDDPTRLEPAGVLFFERDGQVVGDHAGQIVVDDDGDRLIVLVSAWGTFGQEPLHVRHLTTNDDVLHGVHVLGSERLELPTSHAAWDPSLTRIDGHWYLAYVDAPSTGPGRFDFHPALTRTSDDYDTGLRVCGADDSVHQTEGPVIQRFGDNWYVLASDGDTRTYPVYDLEMNRRGQLRSPYGTNIPHPVVFRTDHDRPWSMVTFDGTRFAPDVIDYGTHGDLIVMRS